MKAAGVIAEFDPFHNGHAYFLRRVRELTSADFIIVVMSGDFTQRGNPAIMSKRLRTKAALLGGADIVIELPLQYATASAELFAEGGVCLLASLGCIDCICFGTEADDIAILKEAADTLSSESEAFKEKLDMYLRQGMNYPAARIESVIETTGLGDRIKDALSLPNNILAVEYLKALKKTDSDMLPINIHREKTDHDSMNTYGIYSSARNIREKLFITHSFDSVEMYLPENALPLYREHFSVDFPVYADDLSQLVKYRLLMETKETLMDYADMSAELAARIVNKRNEFRSVAQFTELLKTRNLTYTRISRALLHALLSIKKEDMKQYRKAGITGYARILGFRKAAAGLIDSIKESSKVPVLTGLAGYDKKTEKPFSQMLSDTLRASDIYNSIIKDIYDTDIPSDLSHMAAADDDIVLI